jgi:exodeoxyribonuclease-3
MRLYSWNVNGLRAAVKRGLLEWLLATRPDVLCLQETRVAPAVLSPAVLHPDGYRSYWAVASRSGYSGVATYCRRPVTAWHAGLALPHFDAEGRVLMTDLGDFELYNVYFPNGKLGPERLAYKLDFYAAFLSYVDARARAGRGVIFGGDVNTAHRPIDLARPKDNAKTSGFLAEERAWLDRWLAHGWVDSYRHCHPDAQGAYSWWDLRTGARARNVGWRLDYFFVHATLLPRVRDAGLSPEVMGADHCPVWLELAD